MAIDFSRYVLPEPNAPGVVATGAPSWFQAPADDAPMGYWRKPNGYVILSQYGENGTERKLDRGFERLGRYGTLSSSAVGDAKDPLYPLVARGGLHEMPAEQLIELGWHRVPDRNAKRSHRFVESLIEQAMQQRGITRDEARLLVMPQLEGRNLTDYTCAACPGRWFPTEASALNHEAVMHKDAVQSRSIGNAVAQAQSGNAVTSAGQDALLSIIAQQGEQLAALQAQLSTLTSTPRRGRPPKAEDEAAAE